MSRIKKLIARLSGVEGAASNLKDAKEGAFSGGVVGTRIRDMLRIVNEVKKQLEELDDPKTTSIGSCKLLLDEGKSVCPVCTEEKEAQVLFLVVQRGEEPAVNEVTVCLSCIQEHGAKALAGKRIAASVRADSASSVVDASDLHAPPPPSNNVLRGGEILSDPFDAAP